jgi:hypothetical protein
VTPLPKLYLVRAWEEFVDEASEELDRWWAYLKPHVERIYHTYVVPRRSRRLTPRQRSKIEKAIQDLIERSSFADLTDVILTAVTHIARMYDPDLGELVELCFLALRIAKIVVQQG